MIMFECLYGYVPAKEVPFILKLTGLPLDILPSSAIRYFNLVSFTEVTLVLKLRPPASCYSPEDPQLAPIVAFPGAPARVARGC